MKFPICFSLSLFSTSPSPCLLCLPSPLSLSSFHPLHIPLVTIVALVHLCCHHHSPCASTVMAFFSVSSLFFSVYSIPHLSICLPLIPCFPPQTLRWLVPVIPCILSLLFRGVSLLVVSAHCQLWKCYLHCIGFELSSPWFETAYLPSEVQRTLEAWPSCDWLWIVGFVIWDCILTQWSAAYCQLW